MIEKHELAKSLFLEGLGYFQQEKYGEAELKFRNSLELVPDRISTLANLTATLLKLNLLEEAETVCLRTISLGSNSPEPWLNLGIIHSENGNYAEALNSFEKSLSIEPNYAEAWYNKGLALNRLKRHDEALAAYNKSLRIKPHYAAWSAKGIALSELGRHDEALAAYDESLRAKPDHTAWYNKGLIFNRLKRHDEALAAYDESLSIKPDCTVWLNKGLTFSELGRHNEALVAYDKSLSIKPDYAEAWYNKGNSLKDIGLFEESLAAYDKSLRIDRRFVESWSNRGVSLIELQRYNDALASFEEALVISPNHAMAWSNKGVALYKLNRPKDALIAAENAIRIDPNCADALNNKGMLLLDCGHLDAGLECFRQSLEIYPDDAAVFSNFLMNLLYVPNQPAAINLAEAQRFGKLVVQKARPFSEWRSTPIPSRSLRVGFVSGDFREHPVGYFIEGVLAALQSTQSDQMAIHAYSSCAIDDDLTVRIKACCNAWHSVLGLSDEALARLIHDEEIDILIDLSGHTAHNRLPMFSWNPAPVQATWLGYLATTGVTAIDYIFADPWSLPESEEINFAEKICRLPETYICFTAPQVNIPIVGLPALDNGYVTFGCFNNLRKINDAVIELWARVLSEVPESSLILKAKQLSEESTRQRIKERFALCGISPLRLTLEGNTPGRAEHLASYRRIDIGLDPFPYPGITSSVECLWMGVPILTLPGKSFLSRQGASLIMNAGLPEWIATDHDDFVRRAVTHASDLANLAAVRAGLRQQVLASPIFDAPRFAHYFGMSLRNIWTQWCNEASSKDGSKTGAA